MRRGTRVKWNWGRGTATGQVSQTWEHKVTKCLKGAEITRNGSAEDPALLIEQCDGAQVLKLASEVDRAR